MSYVAFMESWQCLGTNKCNKRDTWFTLQWSVIFKCCSSHENVV